MFRLLPLHPEPDLSVTAAASLAGVDLNTARALMAELTSHVVVQFRAGQYQVHDLLRSYAELSSREDTPQERRTAAARTFDHYQCSGYAAHLQLDPQLPVPRPPAPGAAVACLRFAGHDEAMAWFAAERRVLTALVDQAGGQE
jgi:hypothetical protein